MNPLLTEINTLIRETERVNALAKYAMATLVQEMRGWDTQPGPSYYLIRGTVGPNTGRVVMIKLPTPFAQLDLDVVNQDPYTEQSDFVYFLDHDDREGFMMPVRWLTDPDGWRIEQQELQVAWREQVATDYRERIQQQRAALTAQLEELARQEENAGRRGRR